MADGDQHATGRHPVSSPVSIDRCPRRPWLPSHRKPGTSNLSRVHLSYFTLCVWSRTDPAAEVALRPLRRVKVKYERQVSSRHKSGKLAHATSSQGSPSLAAANVPLTSFPTFPTSEPPCSQSHHLSPRHRLVIATPLPVALTDDSRRAADEQLAQASGSFGLGGAGRDPDPFTRNK